MRHSSREGAALFTNSANGFQPIIDAGVLLFPDTEFPISRDRAGSERTAILLS